MLLMILHMLAPQRWSIMRMTVNPVQKMYSLSFLLPFLRTIAKLLPLPDLRTLGPASCAFIKLSVAKEIRKFPSYTPFSALGPQAQPCDPSSREGGGDSIGGGAGQALIQHEAPGLSPLGRPQDLRRGRHPFPSVWHSPTRYRPN